MRLPAGQIIALPDVDERWIVKALFPWSRSDHPELDQATVDKT